jgi:hypothetical protein
MQNLDFKTDTKVERGLFRKRKGTREREQGE